jgi:tRNA G18 (ribose-2'-O)-methylase SpoU
MTDHLRDFELLTDIAFRRVKETTENIFIAEGLLTIERALAAGHVVRAVATSEKWLQRLSELSIPEKYIHVLPDEEIEQLVGYRVHRGALASFDRPAAHSLRSVLEGASRIVVFESLVDHENVGTLLRSATALGVDAVLLTDDCADPWYRRRIKASMGTVFRSHFAIASKSEIANHLEHTGFISVALTPYAEEDLKDTLKRVSPQSRIALWLGSEGPGLSDYALKSATFRSKITMYQDIDSLNVAAAGAIAFWALGQRG